MTFPGEARAVRRRSTTALRGDRPALFTQACAMGLEGIVSKRRSSPYRSGRLPHWLEAKNPENPAVRREALEDWSRKRR
jgi:ATP-dependent DNA ligase